MPQTSVWTGRPTTWIQTTINWWMFWCRTENTSPWKMLMATRFIVERWGFSIKQRWREVPHRYIVYLTAELWDADGGLSSDGWGANKQARLDTRLPFPLTQTVRVWWVEDWTECRLTKTWRDKLNTLMRQIKQSQCDGKTEVSKRKETG